MPEIPVYPIPMYDLILTLLAASCITLRYLGEGRRLRVCIRPLLNMSYFFTRLRDLWSAGFGRP
jgi:hypothetical protein